jgi:hypothetical protein
MNEGIQRNDQELKSLMRDIANDAIDKSEWLPRKESEKILESRAKKPETIIEYIIRKGYVESQQKDYGMDFLELRNAVYGNLDAKTMTFMYFIGDSSLKRSNAARIYELVSRAIGTDAETFIKKALFEPADNSLHYEFVANVYRCAFDELERQMDKALKIISEETIAND